MHASARHILHFLMLAFIAMFYGCQQEDLSPVTPTEEMGCIVLSIGGNDIYVDAETRATLTDFTGYKFYLLPGGDESQKQEITMMPTGTTLVGYAAAGTYDLLAENLEASTTGLGMPYYSGQSAEFTLNPGTTANIAIALGAPKNSRVTFTLNNSFTALYGAPTLTIGTRTVTFASNETSKTVYFPAGATNYTISAAALAGSHVTDLSVPGSMTLEAAKAYTINLTADPVSGTIIPIAAGTHTGEFD